MAEAKNVTFDSIMRDLKARKYSPVYYLMGDEPYYSQKNVISTRRFFLVLMFLPR